MASSIPQSPEPIALVGSSCRFPGGANSPSALWELLANPRDVCRDIPQDRFSREGYYHPDPSHHGTTNVQKSYLLEEDLTLFDAAFFNISPAEAEAMDPQQRLLLETVYEALESGGHTTEALRGSDTAVYVGTMSVDYYDTLLRDLQTIPTYFATGTNRAIISNRVSYFFDWHGPSMTIDTACSSSLIAVHQGVKSLRTGESRVAVACGTQVILNPDMYVAESKMKMLSPTGRSRMWDADADGYARGEGVAAVIMKRLSDAIADGDHIECIIRETGANQDGFSNGITVPSTDAQAALIRHTYASAGLDPVKNPDDRPHFFEAHGTGTQAGDPKEAAAIHECFGQYTTTTPLYVGSVKTVIGHLEGSAGLAGILKGAAMIREGLVVPNMLFNRLNPRVEPFYQGLHVPTQLTPWPVLGKGLPRRVSVNSFGFGGSNAHAILEEYLAPNSNPEANITSTPFVFSAMSEASLTSQLQAYSAHLKAHADINPADLAWTLQSRRSKLPTRITFSASTTEQLAVNIDAKLAIVAQNPGVSIGTRLSVKSTAGFAKVLGVFTGQGAQWATMGAQLIRKSSWVRDRVLDLQKSLDTLPVADRPDWQLLEEILAEDGVSRIGEASLSQPLCTVLQIILVDLLKIAGIVLTAVVGHSSGEIGAAYAAGLLSAYDAVRIAYYRGLHVRLVGNEAGSPKGAMLAVGTSWEDADELVNLKFFRGRLKIAAHNSPASVTLSGDADAVTHAKKVFDEEKKFARFLKVDTAYHSHHMLACGDPYVESLRNCDVKVNQELSCTSWFSSVISSSDRMTPTGSLRDTYWRDNMTNTVLFADAVRNAVASDDQINLVMEVGPHPALKGPATQIISEIRSSPLPYCGVLSRGVDDVEALSDALGFIWAHSGADDVNFQSYERTFSGKCYQPNLVVGLPAYQWNHDRAHWNESRISRALRGRQQPPHELLGVRSSDSNDYDMRWSNVLKLSEIPWIEDHQLQGQPVFPAAGFVTMALEASRVLAADRKVRLFELDNLALPRAITFEEGDSSGVETLVTLTATKYHNDGNLATADFSCYSSPIASSKSQSKMELMATGRVKVTFGPPMETALSGYLLEDYHMSAVDKEQFYSALSKLGYGYSGPFRGVSSLRRRLNESVAMLDTFPHSRYLVHPSTLDVAFQTSMLAYSAPGDERLWSLHIPISIGSIRVNPAVCATVPPDGSQIPVCAVIDEQAHTFLANINIFSEGGAHPMVQIDDFEIKAFAPATADDDRRLFTHTSLEFALPNGNSIAENIAPTADEVDLALVCERISYYYIRKWNDEITDEEWAHGQPHHAHLRAWIKHTLSTAAQGEHPTLKREWINDTHEDIAVLANEHPNSADVKLLRAVGENIPDAVRGQTTILEHMLPNNLLDDFYKQGVGIQRYNAFLASMVQQITHRYPHADILEIGAGTGGATKSVLEEIGNTVSSYTYTDISAGFFNKASDLFKAYSDKITFKTLDIERAPASQGYKPHSYDIVLASNVLHATVSLQKTLENTRQLLKPGGFLLMLEITNQGPTRFGNVMAGLPGWWLGVDDGRQWAPTVTPGHWHNALRKSGFAGVDAITPEVDGITWPLSIIAAQAIDDRVNFLRRPLASRPSPLGFSVRVESLAILGKKSLQTARLSEELSDLLSHHCDEIIVLDSLPTELEAERINPMSTFINLVDLDTPIFKDITDEEMSGLKLMFERAKHVLWITEGAHVDQPYHMASIAFSRVIRNEQAHINLHHLDISGRHYNAAQSIAEFLLQGAALNTWESQTEWTEGQRSQPPLLWSPEPETFLVDGDLKIPRLVSSTCQNDRLNASRRLIQKRVHLSESNVSLELSTKWRPYLVESAGFSHLRRRDSRGQLVRVIISSLAAYRVAPDTFLFLGIGASETDQKPTLFLSSKNSWKVVPVATVDVVEETDDKTSFSPLLVSVASELLASSVLDSLSTGSHIVVQCSGKDGLLAEALIRRAALTAVRVTFVCETDLNVSPPAVGQWILLDSRASQHILRRTLRRLNPSHYLNLTARGSSNLVAALPSNCRYVNRTALLQHESSVLGPPSHLNKLLADALVRAKVSKSSMREQSFSRPVFEVSQIQGMDMLEHATCTIINWPSTGAILANIRPLKTSTMFSPDKTYLLIGLSGKIGQSLCEWMVENGAGCVCLTSRQPRIDPRWLESFQGTNAIVKVIPMDVTDKIIVKSVINEIRATCPPIAGIAHGAMVLHDALFANMATDEMRRVLAPKIDGSKNVDEAFHDEALDFFVILSSSASVIGNSGQSNYAAANGYINSLVRQRRRRGLAASALDIGRVVGIGYVETAGEAVSIQLARMGLAALSEPDLRLAFAETIQTGYVSPEDESSLPEAVVTTGIRTIRENEDIKGPWFSNPFFSHCIVTSEHANSGSGEQKQQTRLPVSQQLSLATTQDQALEILQDCFSAKLQAILQISDQEMDRHAPLVSVGIDSLVAVEARSWFLKELQVDIPVLKLVGGASIQDICEVVLEKLPEKLKGNLGKQDAPTDKAMSATATTSASTTVIPESMSESSSQVACTPPSSASTTDGSLPDEELKISPPSIAPKAAAHQRKIIKRVPISLSQSRFWFLRLLLEDQLTYNVTFYYHVAGGLRVADLERAVRVVTNRHEALRTCFVEDRDDASQAYQEILASSSIRLEQKSISSVAEVATEYAKLKAHPFDLASGDLLKIVLLTLTPSSHYLLFNHHHIIIDGVSFQLLISELETVYNGQSLGPLPRQYPDISEAQHQDIASGHMSDELQYWRSIFPTGEQPPVLPVLSIAHTTSRSAMKTFDTHQVACHIDAAVIARIKAASRAQQCTPFHFYLAAFKTLLFKLSDAQDLTIGIADAARNDSDLMHSIGFFLNLLPLRFRRQSSQNFVDAIAEARRTAYSALGNSRLPFDVLLAELNVARSATHSPFFQAFLDYRQGAQESHAWGNCQFELQEAHPGRTAYDITLDVTDSAQSALVMIRAQKSLYDMTAANLLLETYVHFLDVLSNTPSLELEKTPTFSDKQRHRASQNGHGADLISDWPETLIHRLDQVARENADKAALKDGFGNSLTYAEMMHRTEAIAEKLQNAGVSPGDRVLCYQEPAVDWICSMLAIKYVGAVYVPLDLRNPLPRLAVVSQDCEPFAILVDATTAASAPQLEVPTAQIIDVSKVNREASSYMKILAQAEAPAAILYTSGSTGMPKGIVVTHFGLRNEIEGYTKSWNLRAEDTLQQSAFTFNHSVDQIYTGLANGGSVYVVPSSQRGDPLEITQIIQRQAITYTKATPSEYLLWLEHGCESLRKASSWRFAFGGGEPLTATVTNAFAELQLPQLRFFNSYGPTEISISSHKTEIPYRDRERVEAMGRIPCGYSLPNYHTYVLDEKLRPLPAGMPGEVYIGGAGVSQGYLHNEALTAKHFIVNPHASPEYLAQGWTRMYRTGDIGLLTADGALVFRSRCVGDTQVKIRGLRIELRDIESNILATAGGALKEAVVTLRSGDPDFLVAHVVFSPGHDSPEKEVFLTQLLERLPLPQYMIPAVAISLERFPLTNHAKIDRRAIQEMPLPQRLKLASPNSPQAHVLTETMIQLKNVWRDVLGKSHGALGLEIAPASSFFLVGGNSLLAIRLQARIRDVFNVAIRLVELLENHTLQDMARKIEVSTSVDPIDWEEETSPPMIPKFFEGVSSSPTREKEKTGKTTILITGATGFLAKHLLPQLAEHPSVEMIHCVAVREKLVAQFPRRLPVASDNIIAHDGDLSLPLLGLPEDKFQLLSQQVDVILHLGGVRSFWDNYHVLRRSNVHPTRELVKLAAARGIPIHYISTAGVLPREIAAKTFGPAASAASWIPPVDGSNGYVATRWASERILERAGASLGVPSTVYRFLPSSDESSNTSSQTVLDDFVKYVDASGSIPDMTGWTGRLDLSPVTQVTQWLCSHILSNESVVAGDTVASTSTRTTHFVHYESSFTFTVDELAAYIEKHRGDRGLERVPILKWIGKIKSLGFEYFLTNQDAIVERSDRSAGARFESRR
ncbi:Hybrid PKS-NRPS synthetase [Penicillium ucsense]|uniref:Hybrid PKS-NRPS synthetase n=1 Tax=Penicillium ucsense TaxID=2839758 RepID=A0A8J8VYK3_9EURO|nr:Hybrid PKS-NRPS synthetase [Penicillium ucsense]KAF7733696.1 Hybrid PKS-NRPS synthetase [Penicillium ucsense]